MTRQWRTAVVFAYLVFLSGCPMSQDRTLFENELEAWRGQRYADLQRPDGYLSLAGLYWLEGGDHSFGSDSTNDLVFPDKAPPQLGTFIVESDSVTMRIVPEVDVKVDGRLVTSSRMQDDEGGSPSVAQYDSLSWYVIKRSRGLAIRLLDSESSTRQNFSGIDYFAPDPRWNIEGRFETLDPPQVIDMPSITGVAEKETVPGHLVFTVDGEEYRLEVTAEPGADRYFVVFGDATSGQETYGGGRFLWVDAPDADGNVTIDFNRAYNPPCVFSPYATCPMPAPGNRLSIRVEAGELTYGDH